MKLYLYIITFYLILIELNIKLNIKLVNHFYKKKGLSNKRK